MLQAWCNALPAGAPVERIEELAERFLDRLQVAALHRTVKDPPSYVTKAIGRRPAGDVQDRTCVKAVIEVEKYRQGHDVRDLRTPVGREPSAVSTFNEWRQTVSAVEDAREIVGLCAAGRVERSRENGPGGRDRM